jgi:hypothetical protein
MVPFLIWLGIGALVTWYHVKYQKFLLERVSLSITRNSRVIQAFHCQNLIDQLKINPIFLFTPS